MEEVERLPTDVKDESSHLSVVFVPGTWFLSVEVSERHIGVEEVDGVTNGRGVADGSVGLEYSSKRGGFEEASVEEVPLEVREREKLLGRRHREPKMGDNPSLYRGFRKIERNFIAPFWL